MTGDGDARYLSDAHRAMIKASSISDDVQRERGYHTLSLKRDVAALGFSAGQCRVPCLVLPIWNVYGQRAGQQIRPDKPRLRKGKPVKYDQPAGVRMVIDVPPRARPWIGDPSKPLFITEGIRKADSAVSRGLCCIALLGVWNWRGTNEHGGKVALADWDAIALNDREVFIVFDSDVMEKLPVYNALCRLKSFLESRGCRSS